MITIVPIPISPSSATTQSVAIQIVENLSSYYKDNAIVGDVTYSVGPVSVVGGVAMSTITATVEITYQVAGCSCSRTQIFKESFPVAFTTTGDNVISITPADVIIEPSGVYCCKATSATIKTNTTFTIA